MSLRGLELLELPAIRGLCGLGDASSLSLQDAAQLLYNNLPGYATANIPFVGPGATVASIQASLAPAYDAGYRAVQGTAPGVLGQDAAISMMVEKGKLSGASASAVGSALTALYSQGYAIVAPPAKTSTPSAPAAPGASPAPSTPSSAPSGASAPNNAIPTNNPFHFQLPTPYTSGGGRHRTPPSMIQQWLPVGLVIAGVVLVIGFGSYAGRE